MKVSRCSTISFVSACYIHVSQSKKKKKNLIPLVSLVKRPRLSHLCNMVTICNVFRLLWSHIVVTAVDLCWQPSLLCPTFFSIFFFHQKTYFFTLHHLWNNTDVLRQKHSWNSLRCNAHSHNAFFSSSVALWSQAAILFYNRCFCKTTHLYSRTSSARALLAFMQFPCWLPTEVSGEIGWASVTTDKPSSLCGHDGKDQGNSVGRQADAFPPLFVPAAMYQTEVPSKQEFHTLLTTWLLSAAAPALINRSSSFHLFLVSFSVTSCLA